MDGRKPGGVRHPNANAKLAFKADPHDTVAGYGQLVIRECRAQRCKREACGCGSRRNAADATPQGSIATFQRKAHRKPEEHEARHLFQPARRRRAASRPQAPPQRATSLHARMNASAGRPHVEACMLFGKNARFRPKCAEKTGERRQTPQSSSAFPFTSILNGENATSLESPPPSHGKNPRTSAENRHRKRKACRTVMRVVLDIKQNLNIISNSAGSTVR